MSKRIFIVYGHHNSKKSFNQSIRDTFIEECKKNGHKIDLINLHDEKPIACFIGVKVGQKGKMNIRAYELPSIILIDEMNFSKNQSKLFILEIEKYINDIAGIFYYRDTMLDGSLSILSKHLLSKGATAIPKFSIFKIFSLIKYYLSNLL